MLAHRLTIDVPHKGAESNEHVEYVARYIVELIGADKANARSLCSRNPETWSPTSGNAASSASTRFPRAGR